MTELLPGFDDLSCDVPKLPQYTADFLGPLLRAGLLPIEFLAHTLPSGVDNRMLAATTAAATLSWLVKDQGDEKTQALLAPVIADAQRPLSALVSDALRERFGLAGLQWVMNGYLLTLSALMLLGGAIGDRFERRRVFAIGLLAFALASLGCAAAPSLVIVSVSLVGFISSTLGAAQVPSQYNL